MATRDELVIALAARYVSSNRNERGRILDEFGDPVSYVQVTPMRYQYQQGSRRLTPAGRSGQTNDIGEYRIYGLSPGQYYVSATLPNFSMADQDTTDRSGYASTLFPGTANVAEASALASLGRSARLLVPQTKGRFCTCAVAALPIGVHS